ncbi:RNA polymerase, sigma 54 (sigma N) factor [uncultured Alphaproteobacteria bacterium]|uniref:RNA polymerase sigma-54 factor n=1 Tax=uncultured Alphaproteobacteria bacterium TaxID=91750 RepID=A0A212KHC4_9PROT|nr:RNA polymerase, sigma 54 (sigma N) factor [uncultured Alphaproteobacteria bacterium]
MAISPKLELRQSQSLVMTPQLQQAIKLLQMSNVELSAFVEQELERNPLLEREDDHGEAPEAAPEPAAAEAPAEAPLLDSTGGGDQPLDVEVDNTFTNDTHAEDGAGEGFGPGDNLGRYGNGAYDGEGNVLEQTVGETVSLRQHLTTQLGLSCAAPADRMIGAYLIDTLDDAGYLSQPLAAVAAALGCGVEEVERVLGVVQGFDPVGVFARSLKECLALQLADRNRLDPAIQALLDNLDLLARRDLARLKKVCGVDDEDLAEMILEIRGLDPKPAASFEPVREQPVEPDILMRPDNAGGWVIELNTDTLPRVLVANRYYAEVGAKADRETKTFLNEQFQSANWLVKSLHQRATTILKVASEIVRQQSGFFSHGVSALKPLILRDIAEAIGMHESTVSRVTTNKYLSSPRGVYELKFFFTQALGSTEGGAAHSAEAVRYKIRTLIEAETAEAVLSDDRIAEILQSDGIDIARRTVAKYREAMKIAPSSQRRREKKLRLG